VKDTPDEIEKKFRNMLLARSGEERLKMGCSMDAMGRALVRASISKRDPIVVKQALFMRFYGEEFRPKERKRILRALRKAAKASEKRDKR
jgi:hypothetical protein